MPDPNDDRRQGCGQAEGRPVRRRGSRGPQAGAVQGQGIRYENEKVRRKEGKSFASGGLKPLAALRSDRKATVMDHKKPSNAPTAPPPSCPQQDQGTAERPRLTVFRSSKHIYAQLIDDMTGVTLAAASSRGQKCASGCRTAATSRRPQVVGKKLAEAAKAKGITRRRSIAAITAIMAASRPWPMRPAKAACSFRRASADREARRESKPSQVQSATRE